MSNFEHRIKEDSTEFEKAFLKIYDGSLWTALEKMKEWQPPKQLVEVPQFVADFIENKKGDLKLYGAFHEIYKNMYGTDLHLWVSENNDRQESFAKAWIEGCTVEKEVYILKHIDLSKNDKEKDWYLAKKVTGKLYHSWGEKGRGHKGMIEGQYFTQSEIDELHTGSYEQIEVDE